MDDMDCQWLQSTRITIHVLIGEEPDKEGGAADIHLKRPVSQHRQV